MYSFDHYDQVVQVFHRLILPARAVESPQTEAMDPYEEVGSILTNLTREKAARLALLDKSSPFLSNLPAQLSSSSLVRRQGYAATLRNITLKAEVSSVNIMKDLASLCQ